MIWQIIITLLLILGCEIYRVFIYSVKKRIRRYKQLFQAAGFRVKIGLFVPFGSGFDKRIQQDLKEHGDAFYEYKNVLPNYDVSIDSFSRYVCLTIIHPDMLKEFYTTNQSFYIKQELGLVGLAKTVGRGLIFSEGETWKKNRKLISHSFHFGFLQSLIPGIVGIANKVLGKFQSTTKISASGNRSLKLLGLFEQIFSNVMISSFLGLRLQGQKLEGQQIAVFMCRLMDDAAKRAYETIVLVLGPKFLQLEIRAKDRDINRRTQLFREWALKTVMDKVTYLRRTNFKSTDLKTGNLLEQLYLANSINDKDNNNNSGEFLNYTELVDEFCTIFIAGTDTTSHLCTMAIVYLSRNPRVMEKLRQEIADIIRSDADYTSQNLKKMQYLMAVINQTLRIYGPGTGIFFRKAVTSHSLCGVPIEKGTIFNVGLIVNNYSKKHYADPHVFRPERWLEENKTMDHPFAFLPFSAGKRNCIGQHLGVMQAKILISKFVTRYDCKVPEDIKMDFGLVYTPLEFETLVVQREQRQKA